jgi:hypothetical protein
MSGARSELEVAATDIRNTENQPNFPPELDEETKLICVYLRFVFSPHLVLPDRGQEGSRPHDPLARNNHAGALPKNPNDK